jgi:basic amino acid/polyamine antiporter, APA family
MNISRLTRTKSMEDILNDPHAREGGSGLQRVLKAKDLIALGVGAIIGAGIFATTGTAAAGSLDQFGNIERLGAGPAIVVSFMLVAIACGFCALCYAEFASLIPIAGSAYTYAYRSLGELAAWIIGWDLILEYAVGNVAVAISWSGYFDSLLSTKGVYIPKWLLTPSLQKVIDPAVMEELHKSAPTIAGHMLYFNLPALIIVLLITALLVRGVKESTSFNNIVVAIKIVVIFYFIGMGFKFVDPANWHPFAPNGINGIQAAAAGIFFAYIGFDAVSTAAEETEDPGKNLPIGMIGSLIICTILYIAVSAVMTGMVHYSKLGTADPMATAFKVLAAAPNLSPGDLSWLHASQIIVALGAVFSMTAVLLVFQMGQPRIFFSMSRDGLLPQFFAQVHPVYHTPHVTTIATGLAVGLSAAFLDISVVIELCNIGTLFAFVIVCLSILLMRYKDGRDSTETNPEKPYVTWAYATLALVPVMIFLAIYFWTSVVDHAPVQKAFQVSTMEGLEKAFIQYGFIFAMICSTPIAAWAGWVFRDVSACTRRPFNTPAVPLIPVLGTFTCLILMFGSPLVTWVRFFVWLLIGLVIYGLFGYHRSRLNELETKAD